jgi:hypothetical protein
MDVNMTLLDEGWSPEQAQALLDTLMLRDGIPNWKPDHLERFQKWCAAHGIDKNTVDGQLEFIAYDLCHTYETIGIELKLAKTFEEAKAAVQPYAASLREEDRLNMYRRRV